ncbi:acyl-CoA dehydrogenase family protein [Mycobacterium sp. 236(2023)]|uniref:acyl-CoA dehydrogenase family protein n=1 Tax=Mycobacterium sp. 236(2023) TaxID=3038163 RepID=UPI0024153FC2|nr:acyl-CoA dehydrogenase family protein [Mycobacterium sp. 236(2023)]MDG4667903.1 acyl-CoA/acyl-ACP dehydrogenase [Mycobacterium sp. 236(2023)]
MDRYELRRLDYNLTQDQVDLQSAYRDFFTTHCPIDTVWAAEGTGFDKGLWERLCGTGATSMAIPESVGGDGATLVDLALLAEEIGRVLAPVPWVDHVCGARLLANLGALDDASFAQEVIDGRVVVALDARVRPTAGPLLVGCASVADRVIIRDGDDVVALTFATRPPKVDNLGHLPMAWVDPAQADTRTVVGSGHEAARIYERALDEWRLLTAASLVGLLSATLDIAVQFAKSRFTLGVPIGTLQGISHPLANIAIAIEGGRNLTRRAAWYLDNEPLERMDLAPSAFLYMVDEAAKGATLAVHVQGGLGVSTEAPATAYLVRARGWPLGGGDPGATAVAIGRRIAQREAATQGAS